VAYWCGDYALQGLFSENNISMSGHFDGIINTIDDADVLQLGSGPTKIMLTPKS
jgi:hypothetical protein